MTSLQPAAVLFDFDGTLVDSAESVLASLAHALRESNVTPVVPLTRNIIGPPLRQTLATLAGRDDVALIDDLARVFRADYDSVGYLRTEVYAGVPEMLQSLRAAGMQLHIVTNKRIAATHKILGHLGWTSWFSGIYALDALTPPAPDKPHLVRHVLQTESLAAPQTWMVGDSAEDQRSAMQNALRFFAAGWGYGNAAMDGADTVTLTAPAQLLRAAGLGG
ncbi:MAG: HAD family hydrolase [Steroidobacteraceae bacterium]